MNEYVWRVMKNNRFAGYVLAMSSWDAERKATEYYGKNVWVERILHKSAS
jgi:predicted phosphatase